MIVLKKQTTVRDPLEYQGSSEYLNKLHRKVRKFSGTQSFETSTVVRFRYAAHTLTTSALQTIQKLHRFKHLNENWDSYGADKPSLSAIKQAENMIRQLDEVGIEVFFTAPGPNGEIVVELKNQDRAVEIYFYKDAPSDYILIDREQTIDEGETLKRKDSIIEFIKSNRY